MPQNPKYSRHEGTWRGLWPDWSGLPGDVVRGDGRGEVALVHPRVVVGAEQGEVQ